MYDDTATVTVSVPGDRGDRTRRRSSILKLPRAPLDEVDQNYVTEPIPRSKPAKRVSFSFTTDVKIYDRDILHPGEVDPAPLDPAGNRAANQTEVPRFTMAKSGAKEDIISGLLTLPLKQNETILPTQEASEMTEKPPEAKPRAMAFLASLRSLTAKESEDSMALTMVQEERGDSLYKTAVRDIPMNITSCVNNEVPEQENVSVGADNVEETCLNKSFGCFQVLDEEEEVDNEKENFDDKVSKVGLENAADKKCTWMSVALQECQCNKRERTRMDVVPLEGISPIHVAQRQREGLTREQATCSRCGCRRQLLESTRIEEMENTAVIMATGSKEQRSFQPSPEPSLNDLIPVPCDQQEMADKPELPASQAGVQVPKEKLNIMDITCCAPGTGVSMVDHSRGPGNTSLVPALAEMSLGNLETHANASTVQLTCNASKIHAQDDVHSESVAEGHQPHPLAGHADLVNAMNHPAEPAKPTILEPLCQENDIPVQKQTQAENFLPTPGGCAPTESVKTLTCDLHTEAPKDENSMPQEGNLAAGVSAMRVASLPDEIRSDVHSESTSLCETHKQDSRKTETDRVSRGADTTLLVCFSQNASKTLPIGQFSVPEVCGEPSLARWTEPAVEDPNCLEENMDADQADAHQYNGTGKSLPAAPPSLDGDPSFCKSILPKGSELPAAFHRKHVVEKSGCSEQSEDVEDMETDEVNRKTQATTCSTMQLTCFQHHETEKTPSMGLVTLHCPNEGVSINSTNVLSDIKLEFTCQKENSKSQIPEVTMPESDEPDRQLEALGSAMHLTCFQQTGEVTSAVPSPNAEESPHRAMDIPLVLISDEKLPQRPHDQMELGTPQSLRKETASHPAIVAGSKEREITTGPQQTSSLNVTVAQGGGQELSSISSKKGLKGRPDSSSLKKAPSSSSSRKALYKSFGSAEAFRQRSHLPDDGTSKAPPSGRHVQRALFGKVAALPSPFVLTPGKTSKDENTKSADVSRGHPNSPQDVTASAMVAGDDHAAGNTLPLPTSDDKVVCSAAMVQPLVCNESMPSFCDTSFRKETQHSVLFSTSQCETTTREERQRKSATFFVQKPDTALPAFVEMVPKALSHDSKSETFAVPAGERANATCDVAAAASFMPESEATDVCSSPLHKVARRTLREDKARTPTRLGWNYSQSPTEGGSEGTAAGAPGSIRRTPVKTILRQGRTHNPNQPASALKVRGSSSKKMASQMSAEPTKGAITPTPMKARLRNAGKSVQLSGKRSTEPRHPGKHPREATPESAKKRGASQARKVARLLGSKKKVLDEVPQDHARKQSPRSYPRLRAFPEEALRSSAVKPASIEPSVDAAFDTAVVSEGTAQSTDSDSLLSGVSKLPELSIYTATLQDIERYAELGISPEQKKWLERLSEPTPERLLEQLYWTLPSDSEEGQDYIVEELSEERATFLFLNDRLALTVTLGEPVSTRNRNGRCKRVKSLELRSAPLSTPCSRFLHKMFLKKTNAKCLSDMCRTTDYLGNVLMELSRVSAECGLFVEDFTWATRKCMYTFKDDGSLCIQFISTSKGLWFYLTFKIDIETYPDCVILPTVMEIKYALTDITLEKVNNILGQVPPGKMYLSRMENALHQWLD